MSQFSKPVKVYALSVKREYVATLIMFVVLVLLLDKNTDKRPNSNNMINKTWEKKFDDKYQSGEFGGHLRGEEIDWDLIKQFISKTISEIAEEQIEKINKRKEEVRKSEGAFKYDWCYDECIDLIKSDIN